MIKNKEKTVLEAEYFCDICKKQMSREYSLSVMTCSVCKRDVCKEHREHYGTEPSQYDNSISTFCKDCWSIMKEFFEIIKPEKEIKIEEIRDEIDTIERQFVRKCKENIASKESVEPCESEGN